MGKQSPYHAVPLRVEAREAVKEIQGSDVIVCTTIVKDHLDTERAEMRPKRRPNPMTDRQ